MHDALKFCECVNLEVSMTAGMFFYFTVLSKCPFYQKTICFALKRHFWRTLMAHMFGLYLVSRLVRAWQSGPDYTEQTNKPLPFCNRSDSLLIDMGFVPITIILDK